MVYLIQDRINFTHDLPIPKPNHPITLSNQELGSDRIHIFLIRVLPAIDFNNYSFLKTGEIDNIRTDDYLAFEFIPIELITPEMHP